MRYEQLCVSGVLYMELYSEVLNCVLAVLCDRWSKVVM